MMAAWQALRPDVLNVPERVRRNALTKPRSLLKTRHAQALNSIPNIRREMSRLYRLVLNKRLPVEDLPKLVGTLRIIRESLEMEAETAAAAAISGQNAPPRHEIRIISIPPGRFLSKEEIMGTAGYIEPEQIDYAPERLDYIDASTAEPSSSELPFEPPLEPVPEPAAALAAEPEPEPVAPVQEIIPPAPRARQDDDGGACIVRFKKRDATRDWLRD